MFRLKIKTAPDAPVKAMLSAPDTFDQLVKMVKEKFQSL